MFRRRMAPPDSTLVADDADAERQRARAVLNRFIFRGMLFSMGSIAVVLHRVLPSKTVAWEFAKFSARNLARACGVRVRMHGLEHLAGPGPYIFAPNHQSHFDMGMVPVDRDNPLEAIQLLNRVAVEERCSLIIFPEGTRSRDGALLPFKKGPFAAAIFMKIPVVPVACRGTAAIMPKGGYLSILPGECDVFVEPPIPTAGLTYDDRGRLRDEVRAIIAARLAEPASPS